MRTTVPATDLGEGVAYGLGIVSTPLSCGGEYWGHGGDIFGFHTANGATDDGRAASVAVTVLPDTMEQIEGIADVIDGALCTMPASD